MQNEVLDFISRRFKNDCNWMTGNCYFFAVILKSRFSEGSIYYDVIVGHFVFKYQNKFYDWTGLYHFDDSNLVSWDEFDKYDSLQKEVIIRDCIM
jgi:hypothetical protein